MQEDEQTDVDKVCDAIYQAILERRLEPNTRLVETKLASALGTSRPVVRQALLLMAQRKLVEIKSCGVGVAGSQNQPKNKPEKCFSPAN